MKKKDDVPNRFNADVIRCKHNILTDGRNFRMGEIYEYKYCPDNYNPHLVKIDDNGDYFSDEEFNNHFEQELEILQSSKSIELDELKSICYKYLVKTFEMGLKSHPTNADNSEFGLPFIELTIVPNMIKEFKNKLNEQK